ncbi:MAG: hypothetical protein M0R06_07325 [Sphaerochaeta sp.]|jgi:vacuolar-type H+-ATPase subunit I/STV1|nr:hypothetical protein [Sphaerochaeta sp.]
MADEPTTAVQDAPPQDAGLPSAGDAADTSQTPKTYTEAELEAELSKRVSDKLAEHGRKAKKEETGRIAGLEAQIASLNDRMIALQKERDEAERSKYEGNPEGLSLWEEKRKLREERAAHLRDKQALEKQRQDLEEELKEAKELKAHKQAVEIAKDYTGVDPADLVDLTDGSRERMEALAKRLGKPKEVKVPPPAKGETKPDSGASKGTVSDTEFLKMYAQGKSNDHLRAQKLMKARGGLT